MIFDLLRARTFVLFLCFEEVLQLAKHALLLAICGNFEFSIRISIHVCLVWCHTCSRRGEGVLDWQFGSFGHYYSNTPLLSSCLVNLQSLCFCLLFGGYFDFRLRSSIHCWLVWCGTCPLCYILKLFFRYHFISKCIPSLCLSLLLSEENRKGWALFSTWVEVLHEYIVSLLWTADYFL